MSIHELAGKVAYYIARETKAEHIQELRMAFGLELLFGELVKLLVLLTLAYIAGILPEILVMTAAASILRLASGGEHCSEYYRCLVGGTLCFLLLGWAVHNLNPLMTKSAALLISLACSLIAEVTLWKYAPGDTENKPITDEAEKQKFKRWSLFLVAFYLCLMLLCSRYNTVRWIVLPVTVGMMEQVFTVTPWGYRFLHFIDRAFDFGNRSENINEFENPHR